MSHIYELFKKSVQSIVLFIHTILLQITLFCVFIQLESHLYFELLIQLNESEKLSFMLFSHAKNVLFCVILLPFSIFNIGNSLSILLI